jgi:prepilin-type N-terminal cleavage/methylation domain-containing protein
MLRRAARARTVRSGFSLLEVMICLVILAIALPAFLGAIVQNVQIEAMDNELNIAVNSVTGVIENVHILGYSEVNTTNLPQTFEAAGLGADGQTVKLINSAGSTQVGRVVITENVQGTVRTVQVQVSWRGATGGDRTIQAVAEVNTY